MMFLPLIALIALASAAGSGTSTGGHRTQCQGSDAALRAWKDAQGHGRNFFPDNPDQWGYTNNVWARQSSSDLFYFTLVDYLCMVTPVSKSCKNPGQIRQVCNADGTIDIDVTLQIQNANTWVSVISADYYADITWEEANVPIYGCLLSTDRVLSTRPQNAACQADPNWEQHLALSDGTWKFTYRLTNASCTCDKPDVLTNYAYDAVAQVPWDNDVRFRGSGFFYDVGGTGIYQNLSLPQVAGTHSITQTTAGEPVPCQTGDIQCWLTEHGMANIQLRPQGSSMELLDLRKFLKSLFLVPAYSPYLNPHAQNQTRAVLKNAARAPLKQAFLKK